MKTEVREFFTQLQNKITAELDQINGATYHEDQWQRPDGGGGITRVYSDSGKFLEKGGVNFSEVHGKFSPEFAQTLPVGEGVEFYATGISLVLHPQNPFAPTVHANYRYLQRGDAGWFGGGSDLTPNYFFREDAEHFHRTYKRVLTPFGADKYPQFKKHCDEYFYIPHRGETRGLGGIFFDYQTGPFEETFSMIQACGNAFLDSYIPVVKKRMSTPFSPAHTEWQQVRRGRYVEFNLIYDRGTTFGLKTNGRVESILMSLPAHARWVYDHHPAVGSPEAELLALLKKPIEYV